VFPWVAADANGHVAIAWYGADVAGNSNTVPAASTHWNVFVAESVNGHAITPFSRLAISITKTSEPACAGLFVDLGVAA
jgi:hypothetical protein